MNELLWLVIGAQITLLIRLSVTGSWQRRPLFTLWLICDTLKRCAYDSYSTDWYALEPGRLILALGSLVEAGLSATTGLGRSVLRMAASLGLTVALILLALRMRMQEPLAFSTLLAYREALYVGMAAFGLALVGYLLIGERRWAPHLTLMWLYWTATAICGLVPANGLPGWLGLRGAYLAGILACMAGWLTEAYRRRQEKLQVRAAHASP